MYGRWLLFTGCLENKLYVIVNLNPVCCYSNDVDTRNLQRYVNDIRRTRNTKTIGTQFFYTEYS